MKYILILALAMCSTTSFCCGNEYGHTLDGKRVYTRYFYLSDYYRHFDKIKLRNRITSLRSQPDYKTNFKTQSNIALNLMKLGHVDSALMILEPLADQYPNEYIIIANLGTAYELDGQLEKALEYISKGHSINSDSHLGSEWVHVKILEAKIKERDQPGWLRNNRIIEMDDLPSIPPRNRHMHHKKVNDLQFQIRTRVAFTPAPNKVMANLLKTLADYFAEYDSYENALIAYTYVMEFDPSSKRRISSIIRQMNEKRLELGIDELPFMFKRLLDQGRIDPELLLFSMNDIANELQEEHSHEVAQMDSLENMGHIIDSLESFISASATKNETNRKTPRDREFAPLIIVGILSVILGAGSVLLFLRRRVK